MRAPYSAIWLRSNDGHRAVVSFTTLPPQEPPTSRVTGLVTMHGSHTHTHTHTTTHTHTPRTHTRTHTDGWRDTVPQGGGCTRVQTRACQRETCECTVDTGSAEAMNTWPCKKCNTHAHTQHTTPPTSEHINVHTCVHMHTCTCITHTPPPPSPLPHESASRLQCTRTRALQQPYTHPLTMLSLQDKTTVQGMRTLEGHALAGTCLVFRPPWQHISTE